MGASTATTNGQPTICIENTPTKSISFEACGTGYGFVHHVPGTDFVHFRGKWNVVQRGYQSSLFRGQLGFGFAEIQLGDDELGFQFTGSDNGIETAGPEVSASFQWMYALSTHTELIFDMNVGTAYFHHAPTLIIPQNQVFPFFELSLGLGW